LAQKINYTAVIFFQPFLGFCPDSLIWTKSHLYQFNWVCALVYRPVVLRNVRIPGVWICKN